MEMFYISEGCGQKGKDNCQNSLNWKFNTHTFYKCVNFSEIETTNKQ